MLLLCDYGSVVSSQQLCHGGHFRPRSDGSGPCPAILVPQVVNSIPPRFYLRISQCMAISQICATIDRLNLKSLDNSESCLPSFCILTMTSRCFLLWVRCRPPRLPRALAADNPSMALAQFDPVQVRWCLQPHEKSTTHEASFCRSIRHVTETAHSVSRS